MTPVSAVRAAAPAGGTFLALGFPVFRLLWATSLFANLGTWAQTVAAAWALTESGAGPAMVATIQVAATLPVLLLSLAAGALADIHDRRWLIAFGLPSSALPPAAWRCYPRPAGSRPGRCSA